MGSVVASLIVRVLSDVNDAVAGLGRVDAAVQSTANKMKSVGSGMVNTGRQMSTAVTLPLLAIGGAAFATFKSVNTAFTNIAALVGVPGPQLEKLKQQVLDLAPAVGRGPKELAEALYFVTSAGIPAAKAMSVVEASGKGAASGLGDTAMVADIATSAMNAYASSNLKADDAVSVLVAAVREGKAEPQALASAFGQVIPTAAQMGVSFDQVGGALAVMTQSGLSADEASTSLNQVLMSMLNPSKEAADQLAAMGLSAQGLRDELREKGLIATLGTLKDSFGDDEEAAGKVFGNVRALRGVLNITGQDSEKVQGIFDRLAHSTGDLDKAFEIASADPMFKMNQGLAKIKVALYELGAALIPVVVPAFVALATAVSFAVGLFDHLPSVVKTGIVIFAAVVAAIGPVLVIFGTLIGAVGTLIAAFSAGGLLAGLTAPFLALIGPIALVVGAIALLAIAYKTNFLGFADAVHFVARAVVGALQPVVDFFSTMIETFRDLRERGFDPVSAAIYGLANALLGIRGNMTPPWIVKLANVLFRAGTAVRRFIEALRKLGGGDSARVHKLLNALPTPLAKLVILFGRIKTAVNVFTDAWRKAGALAAFQTIPRSLELIGRTLGNLMQSMGLTRFGDAIKDVFEAIGNVIGDVVSLVDDLVHGRWSQAWDDFKRLVEDAVRLAIATFLANLGLWRDALDGLVALFDAIDWGAVGTFLWNGFKLALDFMFATGVPYLIGLFGRIPWDDVVGALGNLATFLVAKGRELLSGLYDGAVAFFTDTVVPWLLDIGPNALAAIPGLLDALADKGGELLHGFLNGVQDFFDGDVTDWFHTIVDKIVALVPAAGAFFDALKFIADELLSGLRKGLDVAWDAAKGVAAFFKDIVSAIVSALPGSDKFFSAIGFVADEILGGLRKALDKAWSIGGGVAAFFKDLAGGVRSLLEDVKWDDIASAIATIIDPLTKLANAITAVTDAFAAGGGWIKKGLEKVGIGGDGGDGAGAGTAPGTAPATEGTLTVARFDVGTTLTDIQTFAADVEAAFTSLGAYLVFSGGAGGAVGNAATMQPQPFDGTGALDAIRKFATDGAVAVLDLKTSITRSMIAIAVAASTYSVIARDVIVAQLQDAATLGAVSILDLNTSTTNSFRRMNEDAKLFIGSMRTVIVTQTQDAATRGALAILDLNKSTTASFSRINEDAKLFIGSARTVIVTQLQNAGTNGAVAIFDLRVSVGNSFQRMRDVATSIAGSMNDAVTNQFVGMRNNAVEITNDLVDKVTTALDGIPTSKKITVDIIATTTMAVGGGGGGRVGGGGIGGAVGSLSAMVSAAASSAGVSTSLINAIMQVESGGVWQTSPAGAIGYMQVMPFWGPELGLDLYDPAQNILAGALIIAQNIAAAGGSIYEGLRMYHGYGYDGFTTDTQYAQMIMSLLGGYRRGGRVTTPLALLGEDGPELYAGLQGGHVFTAPQTRALMSGGGGRGDGDTWNVDITVLGNGTEESGRAVARGLISEFNKRRTPGR